MYALTDRNRTAVICRKTKTHAKLTVPSADLRSGFALGFVIFSFELL